MRSGRSRDEDSDLDDVSAEEILGLGNGRRNGSSGKNRNEFTQRSTALQLLDDDIPSPYKDIMESVDESIAQTGLTFAQRKAITLMAAYDYSDEQVAAELHRTVKTIKEWKKIKRFKQELAANQHHIHIDAIEKRKKISDVLVDAVHDELLADVHTGRLRRLPVKEKIEILKILANESRLDDPSAATSRSKDQVENHHEVVLSSIQQRYNLIENKKRLESKRIEQLNAKNSNELDKWKREQIVAVPVVREAEIIEDEDGETEGN